MRSVEEWVEWYNKEMGKPIPTNLIARDLIARVRKEQREEDARIVKMIGETNRAAKAILAKPDAAVQEPPKARRYRCDVCGREIEGQCLNGWNCGSSCPGTLRAAPTPRFMWRHAAFIHSLLNLNPLALHHLCSRSVQR